MPINAAEMAEHVRELARDHNVAVEIYTGAGRAWPGGRAISIREIRGPSTYFAALHELAHLIGPGRSARKLEAEASAWAWALEVARRPPTPGVQRMIARSLRSYLEAGRRRYGLRQGMTEPEAGHVFWRLIGDTDQ